MAARRMPGNFASAKLVALVVTALSREDRGLLPPDALPVDPMRDALVDPAAKRSIIGHAYRKGGAAPLLRVGRSLADHARDPTIAALVASPDPAVLAQKWMRFESYHHSANRTAIVIGEKGFDCRRSAQSGMPTASENVLICGVIAGLLSMIGARAIVVEIGGRQAESALNFEMRPLDDAKTSLFHVRWGSFEAIESDASEAPIGDADGSLHQRLCGLLGRDPGRNWHVGEAARALGLSSRTLQRALAADNRSFSSVVREIRYGQAGRMLRRTEVPLAEIGYCCGYADQAHFQRDFLRACNMTPTSFREISHG
jgi:AraC-like DNA-binding protein